MNSHEHRFGPEPEHPEYTVLESPFGNLYGYSLTKKPLHYGIRSVIREGFLLEHDTDGGLIDSGVPVVLKFGFQSRNLSFPTRTEFGVTRLLGPSPYLVETLDYIASSGVLVSERIDGPSLAGELSPAGLLVNPQDPTLSPLDLPRIRQITQDIAKALDHMHQRAFIHQDVKPSNVLLGKQGAKLTDFETAKSFGTTQKISIGTPAFMSPEQARGDEMISPASDQFNYALMLFVMITGKIPYFDLHTLDQVGIQTAVLGFSDQEDESPLAERSMILPIQQPENPPQRFSQEAFLIEITKWRISYGRQNGGNPQYQNLHDYQAQLLSRGLSMEQITDLNAVFQKALDNNPEKRYPSVRELADDFCGAIADTSTYREVVDGYTTNRKTILQRLINRLRK